MAKAPVSKNIGTNGLFTCQICQYFYHNNFMLYHIMDCVFSYLLLLLTIMVPIYIANEVNL